MLFQGRIGISFIIKLRDKDIQYYFDNLQLNCPSTFAESVENSKVVAQQTRPAQHAVINYIIRDVK